MNNSIYGKTMKNLRKRLKIRPVNNAKDYKKHVSKSNFILQKIFSNNFVDNHEIRPGLTLAEPIYVGFSILYLSKHLMHKFHHKYI